MIKKIAIVAVLAIVAILIFASTKPDTFRVERSLAIKAPAEKIFPLINNYHQWATWSPYEKLDPNMQRTFSSADSGKGTAYEWSGNSKAGQGRMEIIESVSPTHVTNKLDFIKPFEGHVTAEFDLKTAGDITTVTWSMHGPSNLFHKVVGLFLNMDKMLGKDFDTGLNNLKTLVEK